MRLTIDGGDGDQSYFGQPMVLEKRCARLVCLIDSAW